MTVHTGRHSSVSSGGEAETETKAGRPREVDWTLA